MDVHYVDVGVKKKLCALEVQQNCSPLKTFIDQVQGKILNRLAIVVLGAGVDTSASGPLTPIPITILDKDLNSDTQAMSPVDENLNRKWPIQEAYCKSVVENELEKLPIGAPSFDSSPLSVPDPN